MRTKETEADYRYFREPDLLPIRLDAKWREEILADLPELPLERRTRFIDQYQLPLYDAEILTDERSLSDYFEQAAFAYDGEAKAVSNWLMNDVLRMMRERGVKAESLNLRPEHLAEIIHMIDEKKITTSTGKALLDMVEESGRKPQEVVEAEGLGQVSDDETLRSLVSEILSAYPEQVATYKDGKKTLIGWFVGRVMEKTRGKANPQMAKAIFEEILSEDDLEDT